MKYKVSVIVPVYNVEKYIEECIQSIQNQTLQDIEIICINDGSKDSSKEILEKYSKEDKRITVINKENGGYGCACNAGLKIAKGEYTGIIESDDFIDKNMFEDLYNLAKENNADIVKSSYYEYKNEEKKSTPDINKINWSIEYKMPDTVFTIEGCPQLLYFHPSIWSCIYKKSFLDNNRIKFVEAKGAGWVDNPFQIQTLCSAKRIFYTDNAYYYYRLDNPSSSSNIVSISNPFDRSDEVHRYLKEKSINDENLLAHLYKREISYIHTVLSGIPDELVDFACGKIIDMVFRMNEEIIYKNKFITEYERNFYNNCKTKEDIHSMLEKSNRFDEDIEVVM